MHKLTGLVVPFVPVEFGADEYARTEDQCGDENRSDTAQDHCGDPVCSVQSAPYRGPSGVSARFGAVSWRRIGRDILGNRFWRFGHAHTVPTND
jgi:hypothetical protein